MSAARGLWQQARHRGRMERRSSLPPVRRPYAPITRRQAIAEDTAHELREIAAGGKR